MRRSIVLLLVLCLGLALAAAPASADPPERFEVDDFWGIFPDFVNGYWVFTNIERADFCDWADAGFPEEGFPLGIEPASFQVVEVADAVVLQIKIPVSPTWLHAFTGDDPFINPCDGSEDGAAFSGDMNWRINDNDRVNEGKRANSFGDKAQGKLTELDTGKMYHYSWLARFVLPPDVNNPIPPDEFDPSWIRAEDFNLHPMGK